MWPGRQAATPRTGELRREDRGPLRRLRRHADADDLPVGTVTLSLMGDSQAGECWTGDGKLFIALPGEEGMMEIDINDDGSLQSPFGELTKKGK
jgi:hypothetical protein